MARERTFRSEGIVLKRSDFGEADRLLTIFTRENGKVKAIAKGARKPQSRKTGHIELFMRSNFLFAEGKDLHVLTQAEMVDAYNPLRDDLVKTTYAAYGVEMLDRFMQEEERQPEMYHLLSSALAWFGEHEDILLAARYYELQLLSLAGFRPQFFYCVVSGQSIQEEDQFFSADLGGLISPGNEMADRRAKPITAVAVKVLRYLQTRQWDTVKPLQLKRPLHAEIETILYYYLTYILERNLKSVDFLERLRREASLFAPKE
ncbi:MAG: DNA repair protein RecO [Chloroflexota bacterium]